MLKNVWWHNPKINPVIAIIAFMAIVAASAMVISPYVARVDSATNAAPDAPGQP